MRFAAFKDFFDREVELSVAGKVFMGILKVIEGTETEVAIIPTQKYTSENYGKAVVDIEFVRSIRLIKPAYHEKSVKASYKSLGKMAPISSDNDYEDDCVDSSDNYVDRVLQEIKKGEGEDLDQ